MAQKLPPPPPKSDGRFDDWVGELRRFVNKALAPVTEAIQALTPTQATDLTDGGDSTLHYHAEDRKRSNHTGTQTSQTISDFESRVRSLSTGTDHSQLFSLAWTQSGHTGTASNLAGFDGSGNASAYSLGSGVATFLATPSSANLASAVTGETGSGALVFGTSPTLATPSFTTAASFANAGELRWANATGTFRAVLNYFSDNNLYVNAYDGSLILRTGTTPAARLTITDSNITAAVPINKVTITAPASSATLTIADGKTLTASNTLTLTGTDSSSVAFGAGGTVAYAGGSLSQFAATTSAQLAGVISDETGSGALVFGTSPQFTNGIGVGVARGTWADSAGDGVVQIGDRGSVSALGGGSDVHYTGNGRFDGAWKYLETAAAANYFQSGATHNWRAAASGTAGNAISWTTVLTLDGSGNLTTAGSVTDSKGDVRTIPQNSQSAAYTLVLADAGKHILHPSADTTARVFTIPANSSVAFPVGTAVTFVNENAAGTLTLAITTDTMRLAGAGTTGSRTLTANGIATALKITSTSWIISGTNLS